MVLTISMSPGINLWCMIILIANVAHVNKWGFTRRRTNFKVQKGHTESRNKFHRGSSHRETERERDRENNHVRKIPRAIYKLYILFYPDCSEIFKARNIHVCFKMGPFLSFLKSRKTYNGRTFSLISLSFITPPKNKRIA